MPNAARARGGDIPRALDDATAADTVGSGRYGGTHDARRTGLAQRVASPSQRGARGDDVVDQQDAPAGDARLGGESGPGEAACPVVPGLRFACRPAQQAPAGETELTGDLAGDELCLVETTLAAPLGTGGSPRDDIEGVAGEPAPEQTVDEQPGEMGGHRPAVAVFESEHDIASAAAERHGGDGAARGNGGRPEQGEAARATQHRTGPVAPGTTFDEQHVHRCTEGV